MNVQNLNQNNWGICGFVAAVQAAIQNNHGNGINMTGTSYDALFPLIKNFCSNNIDIQQELLNFSEVFGAIYTYNSLNDVVNTMTPDTHMDATVGIAMTANAMSRLCKNLGFRSYDFHGTTSTTNALKFDYRNTIYGLGKSTRTGNFRYGLLHWVYVDSGGKLMTWGDYGDITLLQSNGYDKVTHYLPALA